MTATISIIDDDPDVRHALRSLLASNGYSAQDFPSARSFLDSAEREGFACVLTDVRMPDMDGVELLIAMRAAHMTAPVLVMTAFADVPLAIKVMKQGAVDLLEKPFDSTILLAAVRTALAKGEDSREREAEIRSIRKKLDTLTPREHDVLSGLLAGRPNKIIAYELGVGTRTVESHRAAVMEKMGADSLSELVRMSLIAGHG